MNKRQKNAKGDSTITHLAGILPALSHPRGLAFANRSSFP